MASTYHVEGLGVYDGEVCYSDTRHGNSMNELLTDVRAEYEATHGATKGLLIEFKAWTIEE